MTRASSAVRTLARPGPMIAAALVVVGLLLVAALLFFREPESRRTTRHVLPPAAARGEETPLASLPAPDLLKPLTPEEAVVENAKRAPAPRPDQPAAAFKPRFADDDTRGRALECMTQAIYYEAASEPLDGRRAVAQVILNRLHHPAFPATVCGVVYQGSERTTGCQFTFACDGSLRRPPMSGLWLQARKVATEALAGKVFAPVGHATHYHADYVLPYWADSLDKEVQIGRHIFYRLKGGLGAPRAFSQPYRGVEPLPLTPTDIQVATSAIASAVAPPPVETSNITTLAPVPVDPPKPAPILADRSHGKLLADESAGGALLGGEGSTAAPAPRECAAGSPVRQTRATPLDNRLGKARIVDCR